VKRREKQMILITKKYRTDNSSPTFALTFGLYHALYVVFLLFGKKLNV
jgi:hypothetical protein